MPTLDVKDLAGDTAGTVDLDEAIFGIEPNLPVMHQVVTAQLAARRVRHPVHQDPGRGPRRWRQAVEAEGHRPARQGSIRAPQWRGGGVALGPSPAPTSRRPPRRWCAWPCARPCPTAPPPSASSCSTPGASTPPRPRPRARPSRPSASSGRVLVSRAGRRQTPGKSMPQPARRPRASWPRELNTYDVLVSDWIVFTRGRACPVQHAEAAEEGADLMDPTTSSSARSSREKSYALIDAQRLHLRRPPRRQQDPDPPGHRADLRRPGRQGEHAEPQGQAQAQPPHRHLRQAPDTKRAIVTLARRRPHRPVRG